MSDPIKDKTVKLVARMVDPQYPKKVSAVYGAVQSDIELAVRASTFLPGSGNVLASDNPEETLSTLIGFGAITSVVDLEAAASKITEAFNLYFRTSIAAFGDRVGADSLDLSNLAKVFEKRRIEEITQQNEWRDDATKFQAKIVETASKLGVGLSTPTAATASKSVKASFLTKMFTVPVEGTEPKRAGDSFDWLTERMFDPNSEDAKLFNRIYTLAGKHDKDALLSSLKQSLNVDENRLSELFNELYMQTVQQIDACQKTLQFVEQDYKLFQDPMLAGMEIQTILVKLGEYFGFSVGAKPTKKSASK